MKIEIHGAALNTRIQRYLDAIRSANAGKTLLQLLDTLEERDR